jgi:hypothetical protein
LRIRIESGIERTKFLAGSASGRPSWSPGASCRPLEQALAETRRKKPGLALRGKHQEIYLGGPRKSAPEKLRTVSASR